MIDYIDFRRSWFLTAAAIALLLVQAEVTAFHDSSSLVCNKCHTMHYSEAGTIPSKANGAPVDADAGGPFRYLIYKAAIADLCRRKSPVLSLCSYSLINQVSGRKA